VAAMTRSISTPVPFLTVKDIAVHFQVSERTVWRWVKDGELVVHRLGRTVRIAPADRDSFQTRHRDVSSGDNKSPDQSTT
jgi:excisionase family DNA binding protein